jgi:RND family efflux transporter MFP subunit
MRNATRGFLQATFLAALVCGPAAAQETKDAGADFACLIQPRMVVKLGSQVQGLIREMLVDRGAFVKQGQVVARLESAIEEAELTIAKARAANDSTIQSDRAKLEFQKHKDERSRELRKTESMTISTAEEAQTAAKVAEDELHEAMVNQQLLQLEVTRTAELLNLRTLRSPIDGVVTERSLGPGEYVGSDQTHLLTIAQVDPLYVEVYVPVSQFGKIRVGMEGEVFPEIGGSRIAHVTVVDRVFDAASATIGIRLELPNPGNEIPAGLTCHVRFAGVG